MAIHKLPASLSLTGIDNNRPDQLERSPGVEKVLTPRKSILKLHKRPNSITLRPLTCDITDRFPLELVRLVIDFLAHDWDSLSSCSLVCRAWLPFCRLHFHHRMTVHPGNASHFLEIMKSPRLGIQENVHHLVVQKQEHVVDHFYLLHPTPNASPTSTTSSNTPSRTPHLPIPRPFQLSHILSSANSLAYITKLTLQKGYGENSGFASHLNDFHYLEELEIRSFEFDSFSDLTSVISAQPNVRRLALTDIAWGTPSSASQLTHATPSAPNNHSQIRHTRVLPNLLRLELFMERQAELFNWLLGGPTIPSVEYIALGGITEVDDGIAVSRFLRSLGPVLKHLRLYSPNRISQVNLVHNTGLQSLKISHLHIGTSDRKSVRDRPTSAGDEVCTILSQLCSPHIAEISLQLLFNDPECFATINWSEVARMLSLPRYQELVKIELRIPKLKRWMSGIITRALPAIVSRGILALANG